MGKIVMSGPQNITLDGVVQDPDGEEGFEHGGWFKQYGGKDLREWAEVALDDALGAEAWLLGRRSYEYFCIRWRDRTGELANRLNDLPKYVVSSTLVDPEWSNSKVLSGDVVSEVSKLKHEVDGVIVIPAATSLGAPSWSTTWSTSCGWWSFRSCSERANASSASTATRSPCAWSEPRP